MKTTIVAAVLVMLCPEARALDITSCGQVVPDGETGILQADLVCPPAPPGPPYFAVQLNRGATLEMNGHSITGQQLGVFCFGDCTVRGPGEITGASSNAIGAPIGIRVDVSDLDIHDNHGIMDVAGSKLTLANITASHNAYGIRAASLKATNVTINDNAGDALLVQKRLIATDVTVTNTGEGGISTLGSIRATRLVVSGAAGVGLFSRGRAKLMDSSVTGSGFLALDLVTGRKPRLLGTSTCGHSAGLVKDPANPGMLLIGPTWGVCASD